MMNSALEIEFVVRWRGQGRLFVVVEAAERAEWVQPEWSVGQKFIILIALNSIFNR